MAVGQETRGQQKLPSEAHKVAVSTQGAEQCTICWALGQRRVFRHLVYLEPMVEWPKTFNTTSIVLASR